MTVPVTVPVLTAGSGAAWESTLVAALERQSAGVTVVRRCVDLPDLLAAATAGTARAALLSADLRRLDRDVVSRLAAAGVAVIGLHLPGDDTARRRLLQLGVRHVLPADASAEVVAQTVTRAVLEDPAGSDPAGAVGWGDPANALGSVTPDSPSPAGGPIRPGTGRLVAVWGPTGAPGRTAVASTVASELARLGVETLLVDADVYGGVVAQVLGLLDESPGLAAATRMANAGTLDLPALARLAVLVEDRLRVLTGISRADRWPELRPAALETVWSLARSLAAVTVVDCGFSLEQDEEIAFDTAAPRRNGATLLTVSEADTVLAVGAADPVGLQRLVRGLGELREVVPAGRTRVVITRVRRGPIVGDSAGQVRAALERYAGVRDAVLVPDDRAGYDAAVAAGRTLGDVAPRSPARVALAALAAELGSPSGATSGRPGRPGRRLRRGA